MDSGYGVIAMVRNSADTGDEFMWGHEVFAEFEGATNMVTLMWDACYSGGIHNDIDRLDIPLVRNAKMADVDLGRVMIDGMKEYFTKKDGEKQ